MARTIFKVILLLIIDYTFLDTVFCLPVKTFMNMDVLNRRFYFYYNPLDRLLIENDLNILKNNFDSVSFEFVRYINQDGSKFKTQDPNNHYNLILNINHEVLNYHYSFPFSHYNTQSKYYELLSKKDLYNRGVYQYWRPYLSINQPKLVKISSFSLNPNNYMIENTLHSKIYGFLKLYTKPV